MAEYSAVTIAGFHSHGFTAFVSHDVMVPMAARARDMVSPAIPSYAQCLVGDGGRGITEGGDGHWNTARGTPARRLSDGTIPR